jgi:carbonic anhydrase
MTTETPDPVVAILCRNKSWAERLAKEDPLLFPALKTSQKPEILWIGCADSRVPETTLLDLKPGDVFVHRNIANVLHPGDLNSQSVIFYAVEHLKVKRIILCGHIGCGGVNAALDNKKLGLIDTWLLPIRLLRQQHLDTLTTLTDAERAVKLVELNVQQGVRTLRENATIIDAVRECGLQVHGMVYDVGTGILREVDCQESEEEARRRITAFRTWAGKEPAPEKKEQHRL